MRASVVVATFNGSRYLREQLISLSRQDRLPDEVVAVDDASTDSTVEILDEFRSTAPFPVVIVERSEHLGTSATFDEAMQRATGDVIFVCDQDDRWHPDKIRVTLEAFERHPDAMLMFSDTRLMDEQGRETDRSRWKLAAFGPQQVSMLERDSFGLIFSRQIVAGCATAVRAELVPALLPFPEALHPALPDMIYDRWISLIGAAAGPVVSVPEPLVDYRIHPAQQIGIPGLRARRRAPRAVLLLAQLRWSRASTQERARYTRAHIDEIEKRLTANGLASPAVIASLQAARRHLLFREGLDPSRRVRLGAIIRHLRDVDGYRRFALGRATALTDLIR